jgi:hypothetical protein
MRGRPAGSLVTLSPFTWHGDGELHLGDYLVTAAGSGYEVVGIEETARSDVFRLLAIKTEPDAIPADAIVHGMYWQPRGRRR